MHSRAPGRHATVVVMGILGRTPYAGVAWQVLHYLEGLRRCGCDVWYVEDTGDWPYDAERVTVTEDCRFALRYIERQLATCGLEERWAYAVAPQGRRFHGPAAPALPALYRRADVLLNLTGATWLHEEHLSPPVRVYLETDPVLPQIDMARGGRHYLDLLGAHTHHLTYAENLGASDCGVPLGPFDYRPTRQPVVLDWWRAFEVPAAEASWTTVASWQQSEKDIEWNGELYRWSKHLEFEKLIDLPRRTAQPLELALAACREEDRARLRGFGWRVRDAVELTGELSPYRSYVSRSRGEFTVAKDQYVRLRTGWFSDRSACYLAAGRPVVTQDTGFGCALPTGRGLFAFHTVDDVLRAFDEVSRDPAGNSRAARELAAEYFAAERVVGALLHEVGL